VPVEELERLAEAAVCVELAIVKLVAFEEVTGTRVVFWPYGEEI